MARYSVLTYIIGNYENVKEIVEKDPDAEYILVTDNPDIKSSTWQVVLDSDLLTSSMSAFDKCYSIRFNPFKYCSTDICVRMDGNILIKKSLKPLIDTFENGRYDICLMPHPLNSDFISEYKLWIRARKYPVEEAVKFLLLLNDSRYNPLYKGLFLMTFSIHRRSKLDSDINNLVLSFMKYLGTELSIYRLDLTVYTFVLNTWFNKINVLPVSELILRSDYMTWFWHASDKPNMNIFYDINKPDMKWMFDKEVECLYLK